MRSSLVLLLLGTALVTGCTTADLEARRDRDEATCRDYGFRPRTDAFAECLQRIDLARQADRRFDRFDNGRFYGPAYPVILR